MKILIVTHDKHHFKNRKRRMRWSWLPYYFDKHHKVKYITKPKWKYYPFIYLKFKPDIVIGIGKTGALITALHHKLKPKAKFIFDLNDHPYFYKNEKRIKFLIKNHDIITTPSYYYHKKYNCKLIMNGSNFLPLKAKLIYDVIYIGQTHSIYNIKNIKTECKNNNINLKIISTLPMNEVPKYIAKSKICLYPISWDASAKMTDYAAMGKAIISIKPNLAEKIDYPSYYTTDLIKGIKQLLKKNKQIKELEKQSLTWFKKNSGTWQKQADKYLEQIKEFLA